MDVKIEKLFVSYLENNISSEDEIILIEYLQNNPTDKKELIDLRKIWKTSEFVGNYNVDFVSKEWQKLLIKANRDNSKRSKGILLYWLPRIAAVFLLGAVVSFAITYQIFNSHSNKLTYHQINTPAGAKSKVIMPDGSVIWLNAGSNLKYSNEYGEMEREVELTGEAFFDVEKIPSKVFLVKTSELNIKAYGTTFNVKSYPEEGTIEATLIEGSIGVTRTSFENKKNDEVMLEPNQRVVYYRKSRSIVNTEQTKNSLEPKPKQIVEKQQKLTYLISKGIESQQFTSWKDGTLFISSETLAELVVKLERKYDVKIYFESEKLKTLKFTGSLENETVEQVIEAIGIAANIDYEIEEREIWLKEKVK